MRKKWSASVSRILILCLISKMPEKIKNMKTLKTCEEFTEKELAEFEEYKEYKKAKREREKKKKMKTKQKGESPQDGLDILATKHTKYNIIKDTFAGQPITLKFPVDPRVVFTGRGRVSRPSPLMEVIGVLKTQLEKKDEPTSKIIEEMDVDEPDPKDEEKRTRQLIEQEVRSQLQEEQRLNQINQLGDLRKKLVQTEAQNPLSVQNFIVPQTRKERNEPDDIEEIMVDERRELEKQVLKELQKTPHDIENDRVREQAVKRALPIEKLTLDMFGDSIFDDSTMDEYSEDPSLPQIMKGQQSYQVQLEQENEIMRYYEEQARRELEIKQFAEQEALRKQKEEEEKQIALEAMLQAKAAEVFQGAPVQEIETTYEMKRMQQEMFGEPFVASQPEPATGSGKEPFTNVQDGEPVDIVSQAQEAPPTEPEAPTEPEPEAQLEAESESQSLSLSESASSEAPSVGRIQEKPSTSKGLGLSLLSALDSSDELKEEALFRSRNPNLSDEYITAGEDVDEDLNEEALSILRQQREKGKLLSQQITNEFEQEAQYKKVLADRSIEFYNLLKQNDVIDHYERLNNKEKAKLKNNLIQRAIQEGRAKAENVTPKIRFYKVLKWFYK